MKKLLLITLSFSILSLFGCATSSTAPKNIKELDAQLIDSIKKTFESRGLSDIKVEVAMLQQLDSPKGFYFYRVVLSAPANNIPPTEQYLFYDGKFVASSFRDALTQEDLGSSLAFDYSKTDVDITGLSLLHGKAGAPNIIVKITDFECPFCRRTNAYLEQKLAGRDDVAVYIMNFPLSIHPNAIPFAKVFEAGSRMGSNFGSELFSNDALLSFNEQQIIDYFALRSGDEAKFKELYASEEIAALIPAQMQRASALGVNATPVLYINGKKIEGFNPPLMNRAFNTFK
ncbi:MAG: thioredoxin domain-containing protein [Deferribacteraceae bacterium]|jgi:protein-disulfide isomerase|nr:thioredoxin domain-containing protein [Deferribacteraceae bacterium]